MKNSNTASDNISICDNYIYDFHTYLNVTLVSDYFLFKSYIKDIFRVIGKNNPLANAFNNFYHSYMYKLFLDSKKYNKRLYHSTTFFIMILLSSIFHSKLSPFSNSKVSRMVAGMVVVNEPEINCIFVNLEIILKPPINFSKYYNICIWNYIKLSIRKVL